MATTITQKLTMKKVTVEVVKQLEEQLTVDVALQVQLRHGLSFPARILYFQYLCLPVLAMDY